MPRPTVTPLGLVLARTQKAVERAFDDALTAAGGSRPTWLALLTLTSRGPSSQADIAESMGLRAATVSHHLSGMEATGLITRVRLPDNRRVHEVRMTEAGEHLFQTLATAARAHDRRLHANLDEHDTARLRALLDQVRDNVIAPAQAQPATPSAGSRNRARHTVRP